MPRIVMGGQGHKKALEYSVSSSVADPSTQPSMFRRQLTTTRGSIDYDDDDLSSTRWCYTESRPPRALVTTSADDKAGQLGRAILLDFLPIAGGVVTHYTVKHSFQCV